MGLDRSYGDVSGVEGVVVVVALIHISYKLAAITAAGARKGKDGNSSSAVTCHLDAVVAECVARSQTAVVRADVVTARATAAAVSILPISPCKLRSCDLNSCCCKEERGELHVDFGGGVTWK